MNRFRLGMMVNFVFVVGLGASSVHVALAQQTTALSLEESLTTQYRQGALLTVNANGVVGVNAACQVRPGSIFKDGQLHAPGFVQNTLVAGAKCDTHPFAVGSQVYLAVAAGVSLKNNRIDFIFLQCDVADCTSGVETAYKGQVAFEFPKGFLASAALGTVQDTIKRVFSVATQPSAPSGATTPRATELPVTGSSSGAPSGLYVSAQDNADRLQLNTDGSFSLQEGGQPFSGTYSLSGATLRLHIVQLQKDVDIGIQGAQLIVNGNEIWVSTAAQTPARQGANVELVSTAQLDSQQNDPNAMAARMLGELPSSERIGQAVRVFLGELKQKGALPQEAFAVATPTVMPSKFDMGPGGAQPSVTEATGIFEMRNATYECGSADSGPKSKSKKGSIIYTLSAKIRKQDAQKWILQEVDVTGRGCSPTWQVQIPIP